MNQNTKNIILGVLAVIVLGIIVGVAVMYHNKAVTSGNSASPTGSVASGLNAGTNPNGTQGSVGTDVSDSNINGAGSNGSSPSDSSKEDASKMQMNVTLTGTYVCLPHTNTSGAQTDECALGIKADSGDYYALSFNQEQGGQAGLATGQRIKVTGNVTPSEMLSSGIATKYVMKGILLVTAPVVKL